MGVKKYIMVIDEGTTSVRAIIFDKKSSIIAIASRQLEVLTPKPGWVEQDAVVIWERTVEVMHEVLENASLKPENIAAIGITNQRMTNVLWDKKTGEPLCYAPTWQDTRALDLSDELNGLGKIKSFRSIGKLVLGLSKVFKSMRHSKRGKFFITLSDLKFSPLFMGVQTRWVLDNIKNARVRAEKSELLVGTIDTWLVWKLTGGKVHATDYSNVSATCLFDPYKLEWSKPLLEIIGVPTTILPEIRGSSDDYGTTEPSLFGAPIPIRGVIADQQSALFGETCFEPGEVKCTNGTGTFINMNVGSEPIASTHGLIPLVAWKIKDEVTYTIEGYILATGSTMQWLQKNAGLINDVRESETLAQSVEDTSDVYFIPAFSGLSSPFWDQRARGTVVGLTRRTTKAHLVRAALEAIGYRCRDILKAMEIDTGLKIKHIRADGGASQNNFLLQFLADMAAVEVDRPKNLESTALGAAFMAGLYVNYWKSLEEIKKLRETDRTFKPTMSNEKRDHLYARWNHAVKRSIEWAVED